MSLGKIAVTVGKRLRSYRLRNGLSQEQLAERAGVHPTYIGQVERGEKNLTLESLGKMCGALELPYSQLFEGLAPQQEGGDIPLQCYELINELDGETQRRALTILLEISRIRCKK